MDTLLFLDVQISFKRNHTQMNITSSVPSTDYHVNKRKPRPKYRKSRNFLTQINLTHERTRISELFQDRPHSKEQTASFSIKYSSSAVLINAHNR